MNAVAFV